jgi:putative ATP-dependent endonuclease of the OLD family
MYLSNVQLVNFRNFKDFSIDFQSDLTVLLGENNIGKTNLIDAIRIVLNSSSEGRDIWARLSDIYHSSDGETEEESFEIHLTFADLSSQEWTLFNRCQVGSGDDRVAKIHFRYRKYLTSRGIERGRPEIWVGETEGTEIEAEAMAEIKATFLPALRNVEIDLRPGRSNRIYKLLSEIAEENERDEMVQKISNANSEIRELDMIKRAKDAVNRNLGGITGDVRPMKASLAISAPEFQEIANSIQVLVGRYQPAELSENGLGYNNVLYISAVLGELSRSADNEVTLPVLLIEEPEAHLHPQLQMRLISHLVDRDDTKVQVILTSHSPTLASKFPLDKIVVLYEGRLRSNRGHPLATSISRCDLSDSQKQDLQRYLDITKSTLFFSRGIILVEGISEALLLPVLAKKIGVDLALHDVTIVNVASLAFEPFIKLFQERGIAMPCAVLTDSDPSVTDAERQSNPDIGDFIEYPEQLARMSATAERLKSLETDQVRVFLPSKTFEYDLALQSENNVVIMTAIYRYKLGHPDIGKEIKDDLRNSTTDRERAKAFFKRSVGKYPKDKGRFAQKLASYLEPDGKAFEVPAYIQDAIYHAIDLYALYKDGLARLLVLIDDDLPIYVEIESKQSDLDVIVSDIHQNGPNDELGDRLDLLINELNDLCEQSINQSFRQFCGLKC